VARRGNPRPAGSVALICFLPDYGHLQPLLKIADALAERGYEIKCYVPAECEPLMRRFEFDVTLLPSAQLAEQKKLLAGVFSRGLFFNAVCSYVHYLLCYPPVAQAASGFAQQLARQLTAQRPDVIVCDAHFFGDWCVRIARSLGVPLVINSLDGSLAYNQRTFVQIYGVTAASSLVQSSVEIAAAALKQLCAHYYRLRFFPTWYRLRATKHAARAALDAAFPLAPEATPARIERVVVGTAKVERDRLTGFIRTIGADRPEFPPIGFRTRAPVPEALSEWIARGDTPVVYVSFGSAVEFERSFAIAVYEGLRNVPARVLWSLPANQKALLTGLSPADNIRLENFVPQAEVLALPAVRCFITQAGPNSVQEALLGGTPMLCIPFFADQGYNSATVEHLRVGRKLWHRAVSAQSVGAAVVDILTNDAYRATAADIQEQLLREDGGELIARYIAGVASRGETRPSDSEREQFTSAAGSALAAAAYSAEVTK
jgi:UDP:flavonoid glycosyltransferase YjiC (YdhE family)